MGTVLNSNDCTQPPPFLFVCTLQGHDAPAQQQQSAAAAAASTAATAAAGAAAAIHRGGSSRGVRHLQQQQKLLQQQHQQNQAQQRQQLQQQQQQQQQPTAQQKELLQSMQQLHQAQQPAVFQPDRCASSNLHSQVLLGKLPTQTQQICLQQAKQQQQHALQEDFESLAFFLSTLHGQRSTQAAEIKESVADLDAQIAQVQAALQQLQQQAEPQQQQQAHAAQLGVQLTVCGPDAAPGGNGGMERPSSAGSGTIGEMPRPEERVHHAATATAAEAAAATANAAPSAAGNKKRAADVDDSDDDDEDEMDRRERSRRHKRQRVVHTQQQPAVVAADAAGQLQLLRRASSNTSGVQLLDDAAAAEDQARSAAAEAGVSAEVLLKWQHVSGKFDMLQSIYLQHKQGPQQQQQQAGIASSAADVGQSLPGFLQGFGDDLWSYSRYSRLAVRGTVRAAADLLGGASAMVCAAAFDRDDEYVATAGVSKRIRIFEYGAITSGSCGANGCTTGRPGVGGAYGSCSSLSGSEGQGWSHGGGMMHHGGGGFGAGAGGAAAAAQDSGVVYPVLELNSRSRLSCVAWSPYVKAQLASSDYEGVVQLWDANTGSELMQLEEHTKRAWAVDFSRLEPTRLVSSSDDGTVKLWSIHQEASVGTLQLHANVCSVQFSPESPHLLAAGCANYRFYLYDLRNTSQPLVCVPGHRRSVSYVKWLDAHQLVTASTDNTLRRWSVPELLATANSSSNSTTREITDAAAATACRMTYRGHTNNRNFIGLAVLPGSPSAPAGGATGSAGGSGSGGYMVCGSESNEAYVYHSSMPLPVTSHSFQSLSLPWGYRQQQKQGGGRASCSDLGALADLADGATSGAKSDLFVSCVAWNRRQGTCVAANSAGHIQVLELV